MFINSKSSLFFSFIVSFGLIGFHFLFGETANQDSKATLPTASQITNTPLIQTSSPHLIHPGKAKICLNMIVKNESAIIERCLNSAKDHIHCISICDTGSTDNTVEIIEQFMKKNQIPGKVHRHEWKNFGHNRTLSAQAAQLTLKELGFSLPDTYLLLLDADMILEVDSTFKQQPLVADNYLFLQYNDFFSHYNTRLIRASLPWECVGLTHEYWSCPQSKIEMQMDSIKIDDRGDGGCKGDKFQRDIALLTEGLKKEPENARYMFYLAQSYKCLRNFNEAIKWYKARIDKGGWQEEVWYSKMMIGEIYEDLDFWDQALHWYLEAFQSNYARAEPLQKIATHYRLKGQNDLAYLFAKQGSKIPFPKDQLLFISDPVYKYQFDEEISIAAYYIPQFKEEGFEAADRLALKHGIPSHIKEQSYKNLVFYAPQLPDAEFKIVDTGGSSKKENCDSLTIKSPTNSSYDFSRFQQTTSPIELDHGYLLLVHEKVDFSKDECNHLHRFVHVDKDSQIQKISRPFVFKQKGEELCSAMTLDPSEEKLLIPISIKGKENSVCSVSLQTVRSLLKPLP